MIEIHSECPLLPNNVNCPCRRLLNSWNTDDLPPVVCQDIMRVTVRRWVNDRAADVEKALTTSRVGLRPLSRKALDGAAPELAGALSSANRYVAEQDLLARWPFPVGGSYLALVLRQWVQEDANETLANQMASNEDWRAAMTMFAERMNRPARTFVIHSEDDDPRTVTVPSRSVREGITTMHPGAGDGLFNDIRSVLAECLLPQTPATLGYSLAQVVGEENIESLPRRLQSFVFRRQTDGRPLPARGVLLETHLFARLTVLEDETSPSSSDAPVWLVQPDAQFRLSADSALVTGPFIKDHLAGAMLAHRAFATSLAKHPLADTHTFRKAQAGRMKPLNREGDAFGYVDEAWHEARSERKRLLGLNPDWTLDPALDRLLNKVQKRVAQRRKRAGLPVAPTQGWRHVAKRMIVEDLVGESGRSPQRKMPQS